MEESNDNQHSQIEKSHQVPITRRNLLKGMVGIAGLAAVSKVFGREPKHESEVTQNISNDSNVITSDLSYGEAPEGSKDRSRSGPYIKGVERDPLEYNPEAPTDFITSEELGEVFHTKILNIEGSNFVRLRIRREAENESPFKELKNGNDELIIFLMDGPTINPAYFTQEQRDLYPKVVTWMGSVIERQKQEELERIDEDRDVLMSYYNEQKSSLDNKVSQELITQDQYKVQRAKLDYDYRVVLGNYTDDDFVMNIKGMTAYADYKDFIDGKMVDVRRSYVFLPMRNFPKVVFESGGITDERDPGARYNVQPEPRMSYPIPEQYSKYLLHSEYPMGAQDVGFALRHELAHVAGVDHPYADWGPNVEIIQASMLREKTGDDSKYYLVFETPEGMMITHSDNNQNSVSSGNA